MLYAFLIFATLSDAMLMLTPLLPATIDTITDVADADAFVYYAFHCR